MLKMIPLVFALISAGAMAQQIAVTVIDSTGKTVSTVGTSVTYSSSGVLVKLPVAIGSGAETPPVEEPPVEEPPPVAGVCGATPSGVVIERTGSLNEPYKQKQFNPSPSQIVAFEFSVPSAGGSGSFTATKTSSASVSKMVTISECPGDWQNLVHKTNGCLAYSTESSLVRFTTDSSADKRSMCVLQPGRTYYVNAVSSNSFTTPKVTCSTTQNCGFYAVR